MAQPASVHIRTGVFLAMTAGAIDAYSYLQHGEVFAGLQTGNLILMGINLGEGHWFTAFTHLASIAWFVVGVIIAELLQNRISPEKMAPSLGLYELALLLIVGLSASVVPEWVAVGLLSMAAAAQLQTFRKLNGKPFTSLMMTGNFRGLATDFTALLAHQDQQSLHQFLGSCLIITGFALGAIATALLVPLTGLLTIIFAAIPLAIALLLHQ